MKFENDSVIKLYDSKMPSRRGGSCISDKNGNLLFYGCKVGTGILYNKNHDTLKNSPGFYISSAADQTPIIIPMPGNPDIYYLFTLIRPQYDIPDSVRGFWYHIVDISKDNGKGEMILKNQKICDNVTEQISATFHADKKSVWIMVREYNTNNFKAYLLGNTGLDTTPVFSSAGTIINDIDWCTGQMKFSVSGSKVANIISGGTMVDICNFDNKTGEVTAGSTVYFDTNYVNQSLHPLHGCEFSPNENFLYVSTSGLPGRLFQIDISSGIESIMRNSIDTIFVNPGDRDYYCLQIGIDQKIYIARSGYYLGCINNPDKKGIVCDYNDSAIYFSPPGFVKMSLPTFLQSYFYLPDIEIRNTCFGDSTSFTMHETSKIDSVFWDFGDNSYAWTDFSQSKFGKHIYADTGVYKVIAYVFHNNLTDTLDREFRISNYAFADFSVLDSSQCLLDNEFHFYDTSFAIDGSMTYEWDFGDSTGSFQQNPVKSFLLSDTFNIQLTVTSSYGCETSITKELYVQPMPEAKININDTAQCFNENNFSFFNPQDSLNPAGSKTWYFGDGNTSNSDTAQHIYSIADTFNVVLIEETNHGCSDTATKEIIVHPSPVTDFSVNDSVQCFNENSFQFTN
ncbi:MAG: PKD domain-containing protein, partial [Bacteroidota bacterium]|nr:PKD domain-containing protein [Bacteroidota bacterium]